MIVECNCIQQPGDISIIISSIAVIISIIGIIITRHISRSQLQSNFFADHFKDAISKGIPEARKKIQFVNEELKDYEELQNVLSELRIGADYFKFANPWFYRLFRHRNFQAEDYIGRALNSANHFDLQRQKHFEKVLDRKLHRLYKTITRKYFG